MHTIRARRLLTPGSQLAQETRALLGQMTSTPTAARKANIDRRIRRLKFAGLWAKLDALWVMAAHDSQAARLNWKNPVTFTLSPQNSPTFTTDQGYTGNGSNAYISTGYNPATNAVALSLNSAHIGAWIRTTSGASEDRTDICATNGLRIDSRRVTDTFLARVNNNNNNINGSNATAGYFCVNRSAANAVQVRKNNTSLFTSSEASAAIQSADLTILAQSSASNFSTKQLSIAHVGGSLSAAEMDILYSVFGDYMAAL